MSERAAASSRSQSMQDPDIQELEARLREAEETLSAIRQGKVDALVVSGSGGDQVFTLHGADHPYRVLVEEMHEGTVTLDESGLILYCNRRFASMMRLPLEHILGTGISRFIPEDQHKTLHALREAAVQHPSRGQITLIAHDGTEVPAHLSLSRFRTTDVENVCVVITDLTEQRRNEAIVKEEQLSRRILDQAAEAIVVLDETGMILRASASASRLAGGTVLFQDFEQAFRFSGTARGPMKTVVSAALSGVSLRSVEATLVRPDGEACGLLLSASPLWGEESKLIGTVVTLTDISERKRAEEVLARQAEELARSNSDLKQFAYSASHDLREPLRHLAIYSEMLQRKYQDKLDQEGNQLLAQTVAAAHRMEELIKGLLDYTQAAEGSHAVDHAVDANVVLRRTLHTLAPGIRDSQAQISHAPLPALRVHEIHLQQLFQNLIGNAIKYRSDAPPRISISVDREDAMCRIAVSDNGIGIAPQYHKHVFGIFKRLHGGARYPGSGIGLAICQRIVQRYGGNIWVESELGKGATFFLTLPEQR